MRFTVRQWMTHTRHRIKNLLGMPVEYAHFEFVAAKARLDWDEIPRRRLRLLGSILNRHPKELGRYVCEAEEILIEEEEHKKEPGFHGVGAPMGRTDRITLYTALRATKPRVVVETGTGAGASSLCILRALERNEVGQLHSIDAAQDRRNVGSLIPEDLRERLHLHGGDSISTLAKIFQSNDPVDFFVHDSLHSYHHMMTEFEWAYAHSHLSCMLCSHDVLMNNAWDHFIRRRRISKFGVIKNLGVCLIQRTLSEKDVDERQLRKNT